jgi:hypothetical protein
MATRDMRTMMVISLAGYLAAWWVLEPAWGKHGLWAALNIFFIARGIELIGEGDKLNTKLVRRPGMDKPFAVGSPERPAGLYAAAARRPNGPDIIVSTWGDALVAFAWQCVLELITGISAATGKDQRGNLLVPVEIAVTGRGIEIVPMARHRFAGSSTLKGSTKLGSRA